MNLISMLSITALSHFSARTSAANDPISSMVDAICGLIEPLAGGDSKVLSLIFLIALGGIILLWFLNENKEGLIVWVLRAGIFLAVLINLFTLPSLVGLPNVC